ncbi:MAG: hypothetical protein KGL95_02900, partial [Patescibacteria group bacterium]|nr:hypothetical protein [Patescibacteria group bacterium]
SPDITFVPSSVPLNFSAELQKRFPFTIAQYGDATSRQQFLDSWKPIPLYNITSLSGSKGNSNNETQIEVNNNSPTLWTVKTKSSNENKITFRIFYFPGWHVYLDNMRLQNRYDNDTGYITAIVPPGEHNLKVIFEDTVVRLMGKVVTLVVIGILASLLLVKQIMSKRPIKKLSK